MKRRLQFVAVAALVGIVVTVSVQVWRGAKAGGDSVPPGDRAAGAPKGAVLPEAKTSQAPAAAVAGGGALSADKLARVEKIRRDYEEIRARMSADYASAGGKFPGGVNAFLKQLALLEREMHADLAAALTARELEDYEMRESTTGKELQRRLEGMAVTDEQRRRLFRVQREFDDRFSLVFDVSPAGLLERVAVQRVAREKIRATLGDEGYAAWLKAEDASYTAMRALTQQQGLPASAAPELWRIKDDYTLRKLEIAAQAGLTGEQRAAMHAALVAQTKSRIAALVGADAMRPGSEALGWLPSGPGGK